MKWTFLFLLINFSAFSQPHTFNGCYIGCCNSHIAFPIGGMGAGMFCLEGTGTISHFSIYNAPDIFNEPPLFAALSDGKKAKVIEGPVPDRKKFGMPYSAQGVYNTTWGFPRFSKIISFEARFPFAYIKLQDREFPVAVTITGWSPFIPTDQDNSGLPVGALEYKFANSTNKILKYVFSYSCRRFNGFREFSSTENGFVFQKGDTSFAIFTDAKEAKVDHSWYRGSWVDPMTIAWKNIQIGTIKETAPEQGGSGSTISIPVLLKPNETKTIKIFFCWYVPTSDLRFAGEEQDDPNNSDKPAYKLLVLFKI